MSQNFTIRSAALDDIPALTALYNHYIENTAITFDLEPWTVERRQEWFKQFGASGRHQLVVAEAGGEVLGYACSTKFRPKAAYDTTVETTIYVRHDTHRNRAVDAFTHDQLVDLVAAQRNGERPA